MMKGVSARRWILMVVSAATLSCTALASTIDRTLTLNVYQVCDNSGGDCASLGPAGDPFFAAATDKIWAQAGIGVNFDFAGQIDNSTWLNIDDSVTGDTFADIANSTGHLASTTVVDVFLVHTLDNQTAYGEGWWGAGGLVMGMDTIMGYASGGRIDTMAHELGHNLGLDPTDDTEYANGGHSNNPYELMASGSIRYVPLTVADINPDGSHLDQLSLYQIDYARQSSLLSDSVPEPASFALMAGGMLCVWILRRRRA